MERKKICLVTPAYNESSNLPLLVNEIKETFSKISDMYDYEIIIVNDGSRDNSWDVITELSVQNSNVKGINLSRNFGHQFALTAGLDYAKGNAVIYFDSDLQHPPEIFLELIKKWESGYKVVHTKRMFTQNEGRFKKIFSGLFYKVINYLSNTEIKEGMADFKLLDEEVLKQLKTMREHNRFLRGMVPWLGHKSEIVPFVARKRIHGKPWYSFRRNIRFAKQAIVSFSAQPLRYIGYLGLFILMISFFGLLLTLIIKLIFGIWFFSGAVIFGLANMFLSGLVMISLGVIAIYISFVYDEVINRPLYVISDTTNIKDGI